MSNWVSSRDFLPSQNSTLHLRNSETVWPKTCQHNSDECADDPQVRAKGLEQGELEHIVHNLARSGLECLQVLKLHKLSGQLIPVFYFPYRKKFPSFKQTFPYFNLCPLPLSHLPGTTKHSLVQPSFSLLSGIMYIDKVPAESSLQAPSVSLLV